MTLIVFLVILLIISLLTILIITSVNIGTKETIQLIKIVIKESYLQFYKDTVTLHLYTYGLINEKTMVEMFLQDLWQIKGGTYYGPVFLI
ncbi:hypothetical protein SAMN04244560_02146 [Thermoanaerobacter thermohydrosulfuricus]|uniref:Uncharacterized protein n=1 Tax=Thermoanaerobacter thermohydrosulfuricus TaxID=1516 RepID=A0A1G7TAL6_THETY|nr:hypothetical protein [Thermoanaerobacter thermohydrosulfuricus]SDG32142.1 hypothetical protein SAMN04244560_02146 [Thermoanaerobacter thermohydrosulfuricus]